MPEARADITTTALHPRFGIPKSRTFSVLSSLTQSFSRGSLTSRGASSRHVSGESYASNTAAPVPAAHEPSFQARQLHDAAPSTSATPALLPSPRLPDNPKAITTAMPPQYWAGRFMALHDRFHNELLEPHLLARICEAQAQSPPPDFASRASAAAQNNPSTSVYAIARLGRTAKPVQVQLSSSRQPSRIPQSATTGAILQSTPYNLPFHPQPASPPSLNKRGTAKPLRTHSPPRNTHHHNPPTTTNNTTNPIPPPTTTSTAIPDDNTLTRRALLHLAQHCATPVARASLVAWQVSYAGRTGRACFLPVATSSATTTAGAGAGAVGCCVSFGVASCASCWGCDGIGGDGGGCSASTAVGGGTGGDSDGGDGDGAGGDGAGGGGCSASFAAAGGAGGGGGGAAAVADGGDGSGVGMGHSFVEGVEMPVVVGDKDVMIRGGHKNNSIDSNTSGVGCIHNNNNITDSNTSGVGLGPRCGGGGGGGGEEAGKHVQAPLGQDGREFGRRGREMVRRLRRGLGSKPKSEGSGPHAAADDKKDWAASDGRGGVHGQGKGSTALSEAGLEEKQKGRKAGRFGFFMG